MDPSSPIQSRAASPMADMLTPRSKVAKMLADIDNADTPSPPASRPSALPSKTASVTASTEPRRTTTIPITKSGPFQTDSSDESDDEIRQPLGRAARRMLGGNRSTEAEQDIAMPSSAAKTTASNRLFEDEELYSVTPGKKTPQRPTQRRREPSLSPIGSERSTNSGNLFVSPAKSTQQESDDDELPQNPFGSKERLAELVAQKRAEREAREEAEKEKRQSSAQLSSDLPEEVLDGDDEESGAAANADIERIMSDASRPTRKASKKALLEMERETQRLSRQQALAHQMKTKKKFTTNDLFARFNFRQQATEDSAEPAQHASSSSVPNSDGAEHSGKEPVSTPPSSPPTPLDRQRAIADHGALSKLMPVRQDSIADSIADMAESNGEDLPSVEEVFRSAQKAKSAAPEPSPIKKGAKLARFGKKIASVHDDSDDELEIVPRMPKHLRMFDNIKAPTSDNPGNSSKAIHTLKHLSHIGAYDSMPKKKGSRPSVNAIALEAQLRTRAKTQAREQQQERIAELKAKGIDIQTAEEREKEAEVYENLLEKARLEAVEIRKAEKAARKAIGGDESQMLASDDESENDQDYVGSGSEDEEMGGVEIEGEEENGILDEAAEEADDDRDDEEELEDELQAEIDGAKPDSPIKSVSAPRKSRKSRIIEDEDDDEEAVEPKTTVLAVELEADDPFAAFGFGANKVDALLMSPTQAFNATMQTPTQATQEDSFDILRNIAPPSVSSLAPTFPDNDDDTQMQNESQASLIPGSQVPENERIDLGWETQPPQTPKLNTATSGLSETPGWEPTQDRGLPSPWTAGLRRESAVDSPAEHETQSTVQLRVSESPMPSVAHKRGRLIRRQAAVDDSDSGDELSQLPAASKIAKDNAFSAMARKRKDALTVAEREAANKEAKGMMDEQAEESEDEYAGIGGDDYVAPETEQDREMIDSSHVDVDERALAAHFAERQRVADEEETSKLYKDLTTGALRRKQANAFDLDEDEDEIASRRRQLKQREEARKRKILLQDDNIAGLAEGRQSKGKEAFLKAIADDDGGDDDMVDLLDEGEDDGEPAAQDDSQASQQLPVLQEISGNKRRSPDSDEQAEGRPPAKQRRIEPSAFRKPASILEVRESLSFLLEEPNSFEKVPSSVDEAEPEENFGLSDSEGDDLLDAENARQNDGGYAPNAKSADAMMMPPPRLPASQRRSMGKAAVVDRLSLKRGSSTSSTDSGHGPSAWGGSNSGSFKAPSLLRRATTSIASGANERGVSTPSLSRESSSGSNSSVGVKRGGSNKSSLAYQARAEERRAIVEASATRRQENTMRIAELRRVNTAGGILGRGLGGKFE